MLDFFYILANEDETWFQLCIKPTHYCIASGASLEVLLHTAQKWVKKYKTTERILRLISEFDDGGKTSRHTVARRIAEYELHGWGYDGLIEDAIRDIVKANQEEARKNSPASKVSKRLAFRPTASLPATQPAVEVQPPAVRAVVKKVRFIPLVQE